MAKEKRENVKILRRIWSKPVKKERLRHYCATVALFSHGRIQQDSNARRKSFHLSPPPAPSETGNPPPLLHQEIRHYSSRSEWQQEERKKEKKKKRKSCKVFFKPEWRSRRGSCHHHGRRCTREPRRYGAGGAAAGRTWCGWETWESRTGAAATKEKTLNDPILSTLQTNHYKKGLTPDAWFHR